MAKKITGIVAVRYTEPVAIRPTLAKPLMTSGRRRLNISSGLNGEREFLENSLETATAAPIGKDDSIKVISWLNRFKIEPVSVAEKNACGALHEYVVSAMELFTEINGLKGAEYLTS